MPRPAPLWSLAAPLLTALATIAGCRPADEVRTYHVPKERAASTAASAAPAPAAPSRMIAAMIQGNQQAWFFKAMGRTEQIDPLADQIKDIFRTIGFDDAANRPTWELPADWSEQPASDMRLATLIAPSEAGPVEISVIGLGLAEDWDGSVLDNVNRWRNQLRLGPIAASDLGELEPLDLAGHPGVLVDLTGEVDASTLMAPMAGGAAAPSAPPIAAPPVAGDRQRPISYDVPDHWVELPPNSIRLANLAVGEGASKAEVTAFAFPADAESIADPLENVNRWRREIKLGPVDQATVDAQLQSIVVDSHEAKYIELIDEAAAESTLAVLLERGPQVWFFKLRGAAATVAAERESFREWLASIRFTDA